MAARIGIRIRDRQTGRIILDLSDRITRIVGSFSTGSSNGTFDIPQYEGSVFFYCANSAAAPRYSPSVALSGRRLTWTFRGDTLANRAPVTIYYGAY